MHTSIQPSIHLFIFLSTYSSIQWLGVCLCTSIHTDVFLFVCSSIHPCAFLSIHPSVRPSVRPSFAWFVCLFMHICMYIHLSACSAVCQSLILLWTPWKSFEVKVCVMCILREFSSSWLSWVLSDRYWSYNEFILSLTGLKTVHYKEEWIWNCITALAMCCRSLNSV